MKRFLFVAAIVMIVALASTSAFAGTFWTENWDSYTSGTTPYGSWVLGNGTWQPLTGVASTNSGTQAYGMSSAAESQTSRIGRAVGADLSAYDEVVLDAYFYDAIGTSSMKRSFVGFQNAFTASASLLRIGMNNAAEYAVMYGSTATAISTGVGNATGWHHVTLTNTKGSVVGGVQQWTTAWALDDASGNFTWAWDAANANQVNIGYNFSCKYEVDWDDISVSANMNTVPEPGSMLALATGLVGFLGIIRRKRA